MSGKIKSKDLSYDSSLPPFLQRLHAQNAGRGDTDRHERAIARPKREKDPNDDDGPTIVDETGETLTKDEVTKLTASAADNDKTPNVTGGSAGDGEPKASGALPNTEITDGTRESKREQKVIDGTAQKKRKVGKILGEEADDDRGAADAPGSMGAGATKSTRKIKKKAKPIKLAFGEEEG